MTENPSFADVRGILATPNLFGVPHAETLYDDPATVWETDIEDWVGYHDEREWTIEEWTAKGPERYMPAPALIAEQIAEWSADEMGLEGAGDAWDDATKDPNVINEIHRAMTHMASKVAYRIADEKVAEHKVTLDADGQPLLNGQPMYRKVTA